MPPCNTAHMNKAARIIQNEAQCGPAKTTTVILLVSTWAEGCLLAHSEYDMSI
ncbi:hypothetical protein MPER_04365 [Moniliophthora perniciosa FA553]|nr:hypothetical protein MPER_04365 [Moniliophthora perniciosa FA553]